MFEEEAEDDILDFDCKPKNLFQSKVFEEELKVNSPIVDSYRKIKPIKLQKRKVKIPNKPRIGDLLKSLEESFNLQTSDLPDMKDFFSFERKVFEGLKYFDIEEVISSSPPVWSRRRPKTGKVLHDCKVCGKLFMERIKLLSHADSQHQDLVCKKCGMFVRTTRHLTSHLKSHPDSRLSSAQPRRVSSISVSYTENQ